MRACRNMRAVLAVLLGAVLVSCSKWDDMKQLSIDIAIKGPGVVVDGSTLLTRHAGLGRVPCA